MKLLTHFERHGYNSELLNVIYPKIETELEGKFTEVFLEVLCTRQRFQTILESKAFFYLTILLDLLQIPQFKKQFFNMEKMPLLPKTMDKITGSMIDTQSPLGLFARTSVLGTSAGLYFQEKEITQRYEERMITEFGHEKIVRDKLKYYADLQNEFYEKLTEVYKTLLKKDTQKEFMEWNYALIHGNLKKAKLGSRLQNSTNTDLSHDGIMLNAFVVMLNLCKPFLAREGEKYKNINP